MASEFEKAKISAFRLLKFRIRSAGEIKQRLKQKKYSQPVIREVLDFLSDLGYVDDLAFAVAWINNRQQFKPKSKRLIKSELRQKGVCDDIIEQAFGQAAGIEDEKTAHLLAEQKYKKLKSMETEIVKRRLIGFLGRRGFSSSLIYKVIKGLINNENE
jgi:regulatory protein